MASADYFLKLDGVDGESSDDKHKNEIDVESFSWGASRAAAAGTKAAPAASFQDLSFSARTSAASPRLFQACATGQHIKRAVLTIETAGFDGERETFMTFQFNDVLVSDYQNRGAGDEPHDRTSLAYASVLVNGLGAKPPAPAPGPIAIEVAASGSLVRYMDDGTTEIAPSQDGTLLGSGYVHQVLGSLTVPRQFRRGFAEFDLSQTVVAGIAKGPGAAKAKYELVLSNVTPPPSDGGVIVDPGPGPVETGETGPGQHDVLWWEGPDLVITTEDYDRNAKSLGKIMSTGPGQAHAFDVTSILAASPSRMLGFRVQLVDDPGRTGFAAIGSLFSASLRLTLA